MINIQAKSELIVHCFEFILFYFMRKSYSVFFGIYKVSIKTYRK